MNIPTCLNLLHHFFEWILRSSWQGAILIVVVLLAQKLLRRQLNAQWRFNLWLLVLLRLMLPISPESSWSVFNFAKPHAVVFAMPIPHHQLTEAPSHSDIQTVNAMPLPTEAHQSTARPATIKSAVLPQSAISTPQPAGVVSKLLTLSRRITAYEIMAIVWLLGVVGFSVQVIRLVIITRRQIRRATPVVDPAVLELFEECRKSMGVRRDVPMMETAMVRSPALCGLMNPTLLLPPGLRRDFSLQELRYVFLHELAHVKRRDVSLNWLLTALQILHWFNPIVWIGFARMRADRELACDALAISFAREGESTNYGQTIIKLLETFSRPSALPGLVGIMEDRNQMRRRIQMIATFKKTRGWSILALVLMCGLAVTGLTNEVKPKATSKTRNPDSKDVMVVTVLDASTGAPIKGALVITGYNPSMLLEGREHPPILKTDEKGEALVPRDSSSFLWITKGFGVMHPEYEPKAVTFNPWDNKLPPPKQADIPKSYTIKLDRGVKIGGIVRDEEGKAIPNVRVEIVGCSSPRKPNVPNANIVEYQFYDNRKMECPETDAQGRWSCDHFPANIEYCNIALVSPDNASRSFIAYQGRSRMHGDQVKFSDLLNNEAEFVFKNGIPIQGIVSDSDGKPLPGIKITEIDGREHSQPLSVLTTGSDGRFILPNRDPHQILLRATGAGFALKPTILSIEEGMPEVHIQMAPAKALKLRVVDVSGKPIPKVKITQSDMIFGWSGESGDDGRINWIEAPAEALSYMIYKEGYRQVTKNFTPNDQEQTVTLEKEKPQSSETSLIPLNVKVTDSDKLPVKSFQLSGYLQGGGLDILGNGTNGFLRVSIPPELALNPNYTLRIEANGFDPLSNIPLKVENGKAAASIVLAKEGHLIEGIVLKPDGTPAAKAKLIMGLKAGDYLNLLFWDKGGVPVPNGDLKRYSADDSGKFSFPSPGGDRIVAIVHDSGVLNTSLSDLQKGSEFHLQAWGKLEGTLTVNSIPKEGVRLQLDPRGDLRNSFSIQYLLNTGKDGHFLFEKVPPGDYTLYCTQVSEGNWPHYYPLPLKINANETTTVAYKEEGRSVSGRIQSSPAGVDIDWPKQVKTHLLSRISKERVEDSPIPADFVRRQDFDAAQKRYLHKESGTDDSFGLDFDSDGSFHAEGIPPGDYEINVEIGDPSQRNVYPPISLGSVKRKVTIPSAQLGSSNDIVDFGVFKMPVDKSLISQKPMPLLPVKTLDGKLINLGDFRGKAVLVTFWASWAPPSAEEIVELKSLADTFGADPHFVMLGVSLDDKPEDIAHFTESTGIKWINTQLLGAEKTSVTAAWGVDSMPASYLVGTDGFIYGKNIKSERLRGAIEGLLKQSN